MIEIFIPYYRGRGWLLEAAASAVGQAGITSVTVLDDRGPDPLTTEDLGRLHGLGVVVRRNATNLGMVGNWNQALDGASGRTTILHADDALLEDYGATMTAAAARHPGAALAFCRAEVIDERGRRAISVPDLVKGILFRPRGDTLLAGEEAVVALLRGNFIFCPTIVYDRAVLGPLRFDPRWRMVQDLDLILRVLEAGHTIVAVPATCYRYRRHRANATVEYTRTLRRFREEASLYAQVAARCERRGWRRAARVARRMTIVKLNLLYCALGDGLALRTSAAIRKLSLLAEMMTRRADPSS